jgi:Tfp pilus assembly PilM family ATPase
MAQVVPRGDRMVVARADMAALEWAEGCDRSEPAALGEAIAKALHRLHAKPSQVVIGVPRQTVVLRTLVLPEIDDVRELASMVHMQIAKDLPFKQDEAVIDFVVRRHSPVAPPGTAASEQVPAEPGAIQDPPKVEVLVAAVKRETVAYYEKVAAAAKLKLAGLGLLSQANARCAEACGVAALNECVALVTLRRDEVGIDIVAGSLRYSRGAVICPAQSESDDSHTAGEVPAESSTTASAPGEDGAGFVEAVTIELVRNLHSYNGAEINPPVTKLVVAGSTGCEEEVAEALQKRLNLPCTRLDVAAGLELTASAREHAAEAIGAIGLGLGANDPGGLPFDFLNPKRPAVQRDTRRLRVLAWGAAVVVLLIGILGLRAHLVGERMKVYEAVRKELTGAEKHVPTYRRMQQQAAAVQKWVKGSRNWLEQLAYLSTVLPGSENLYVTSISVSGQGAIHLAVQAKSGEILADLQKQLRAAGYELKPLAITPGNDRHGYQFRSAVELIVPPGIKIDLSKALPPPRPADDVSLEGKKGRGGKGGRS